MLALTPYVLRCKNQGAFSGLRQFLTIGSTLKRMKAALYVTLEALFVLELIS